MTVAILTGYAFSSLEQRPKKATRAAISERIKAHKVCSLHEHVATRNTEYMLELLSRFECPNPNPPPLARVHVLPDKLCSCQSS